MKPPGLKLKVSTSITSLFISNPWWLSTEAVMNIVSLFKYLCTVCTFVLCLIPLCHRVPLLSKNYWKYINETHLHWLKCSFIPINTHSVVYFDTVPHTPSCSQILTSAPNEDKSTAENSPNTYYFCLLE